MNKTLESTLTISQLIEAPCKMPYKQPAYSTAQEEIEQSSEAKQRFLNFSQSLVKTRMNSAGNHKALLFNAKPKYLEENLPNKSSIRRENDNYDLRESFSSLQGKQSVKISHSDRFKEEKLTPGVGDYELRSRSAREAISYDEELDRFSDEEKIKDRLKYYEEHNIKTNRSIGPGDYVINNPKQNVVRINSSERFPHKTNYKMEGGCNILFSSMNSEHGGYFSESGHVFDYEYDNFV